MSGLVGRVAFITGGAKGIGLACAQALGRGGARVVIADVSADDLKSAERDLGAEGIECASAVCDVGDRTQVEAAVDFTTGQVAARQMKAQGHGGSIVNISSVNGVMAIPTIANYNASKGGVNNLTRAMALSLAPHAIRVNAVGPGSIMTDVLRQVVADKAAMAKVLSRTPMLRAGDPIEIGNVVKFFASDDSSYITGQILYADGGRMALNYTVPVPEEALEGL
uniref:Ketoreductase domain-containing protein n=1 Tax=Auxenochlorella protothecoides TaxID=3075 RepID=A0A1D1ZN59_AUXPR